jgi:aminopeptidase N
MVLTGLSSSSLIGQTFNLQDTLRGSITAERAWWDLTHYELSVEVNPMSKSMNGMNIVSFRPITLDSIMQIDLQDAMRITKVLFESQEIQFTKKGNAHFLHFPMKLAIDTIYSVHIYFGGTPKESKKPPWDGGLTWTFDDDGKPFIATSVQGEGASIWWPCKDHMYDEPDSMKMHITVPEGLMDISNGRLISVDSLEGKIRYTWNVVNPINNYGVNINVGNYVHFGEKFKGLKGDLDCDYFVLSYNENKAKRQFRQVHLMLQAFEHWFGPYPFYEDGFKLVEVPYLGMEHQSSVTYGNGYENGYRGRDLSGTGWGKKFDFIIIHESGHEWFANNITYKDIADMWIHESFTAYSESLYLDYHFGKEAGREYVRGTRSNIQNDRPIIGYYDVNHAGSGDMYYKGSNMLNTIRSIIDDDELWRKILTGLNETFYHQTVTTKEIEDYIIEHSKYDLQSTFDQYLRTVDIPTLEFYKDSDRLFYRWTDCINSFNMPVKLYSKTSNIKVFPSTEWNYIEINPSERKWQVDENYYVKSRRVAKR